jgi:hypothetical protein
MMVRSGVCDEGQSCFAKLLHLEQSSVPYRDETAKRKQLRHNHTNFINSFQALPCKMTVDIKFVEDAQVWEHSMHEDDT